MSTLLTINLRNSSSTTQVFYFFQEPALFSYAPTAYSNSLFSQALASYPASGAILTFQVNAQVFAGIQQAHGRPQIGAASGYASASRPIDLAPFSGSSNNWTTATIGPLGLSAPVAGTGLQPGSFRITTPPFQPPEVYNIGTAVEVNGGVVLSNFVVANPASDTDCQPVLKYYVQTGLFTPGSVLNFTQSSISAAVCDFTGGYTVIDVTLNMDGTWSVQFIQ